VGDVYLIAAVKQDNVADADALSINFLQHLAVLKAHGILDSSKSGQNIIYSIADHRVEAVIDLLKEYYCKE